MGQDPNDLQFTLLSHRRNGWCFAISFVVQTLVLIAVIVSAILTTERMLLPERYTVSAIIPPPPPSTVPRPVSQPLIKKSLVLPVPDLAAIRLRAPDLRPPKTAETAPQPPKPPELPHMAEAPALPAPAVVSPRGVQTGNFSSGSSAAVNTTLPAKAVQTGGFGDPAGVGGVGKEARATARSVGSFDLPNGPGYGNGGGGARGARGTVASAGFGSGVATDTPGNGGAKSGRQLTQRSSFGDAGAIQSPPQMPRARPTTTATRAVEILSKPKPAYTDEARKLKLEGEVLVEVVFLASGQVRVVRVVRGLGHGLDESAIAAAQQIRFNPARQDDVLIDFPATVHVLFQLAY
jgi:TonB family protein